ncbi:MAG: hypothetical protein J6S48_02565 [Bacteroidales bacterium]|nr:hypothetical protein [Bacteroidales bacterium]
MVEMPCGLKASERRHARSAMNTIQAERSVVFIAPVGASHASGMLPTNLLHVNHIDGNGHLFPMHWLFRTE